MILSDRHKGILCIIGTAFFFSLMTVFIRLSGDLPTMQKALFRNLVASCITTVLVIRSGKTISFRNIPRTGFLWLLLRSICGTAGLICNFYAVDHLNLSDANMLNKLSPFFAIIFSVPVLKEKANRKEWLTVVVAFLGALLVIKPGFSMGTGASLIGFLGGAGAGIAYTYVRKLGMNGVKGPVIVLFFSLFSSLVVLPFFILQYQPMTLSQLLLLLCAGGAAAGGQLCVTAAYAYAPAKEISVYDYTQVIFAALWGYFLFSQTPDVFSILGYIIIIGAAVYKFAHVH